MSERLIPQCPTAHALAQDGSCGFTWLCQCHLPLLLLLKMCSIGRTFMCHACWHGLLLKVMMMMV
jgi:hypothetical protein